MEKPAGNGNDGPAMQKARRELLQEARRAKLVDSCVRYYVKWIPPENWPHPGDLPHKFLTRFIRLPMPVLREIARQLQEHRAGEVPPPLAPS